MSALTSPLHMTPNEFRELAATVADRLAEHMETLPQRPVVPPGSTPATVRAALGTASLPEEGTEAAALFAEVAQLLFDHSLFNAHPRFLGYITASPHPIGVLAEFFAAGLNQNVGFWGLAPMANEIERQTVRWLAEMIGYPSGGGGLLVTGGNMANFVGLMVARRRALGAGVRARGLVGDGRQLCLYCSAETHTWVEKAADLYGIGTDNIRWIGVDAQRRMRTAELEARIDEDIDAGRHPFLVVGTAGSVATGAVDPLREIAAVCRDHGLWFHVDGAYGGFAACAPEAPPDLHALSLADSVAVDPHKWLYAPIEAGCVLVRNAALLASTFSFRTPYYHFDEEVSTASSFHELGPQNTRGFRALKVWMGLRRAGRRGYADLISANIRAARELYEAADAYPELEALTHNLSITTFRYVPPGLTPGEERDEGRINLINSELVGRIQRSGRAYVSNAIIDGVFALRACVVNLHATPEDMHALCDIAVEIGADLHAAREVPESAPRGRVSGRAQALAAAPVFRSAPDEALAALADGGTQRRFDTGEVLMHQGETSDSVHVIVSGRVRIERYHAQSPEPFPIAVVATGETVGEMGVLDHEPRSASVTAIEPTETLELSAEAITDMLIRFPEVERDLLRTFSRRLRGRLEAAEHGDEALQALTAQRH